MDKTIISTNKPIITRDKTIILPDKKILLQTKDIIKVYGEKVKTQVLFGINIDLREQEFVSIIGPSGCGKTTLMNIIGTLDSASGGDVLFAGKKVTQMTQNELAEFRNQNLGFIFQFHHLLPEFTALENVLIPTWIKYKKPLKKDIERAKELLEIVGLKERINNKATDLSGGQQQRVAIARSLINSPQLLLGDEPTGNLDSEATEAVYELLRDINKKIGTAILIVTHDRHIAAKSDRIIEMKDGLVSLDYATNSMGEDLWEHIAPVNCKFLSKNPNASCNCERVKEIKTK